MGETGYRRGFHCTLLEDGLLKAVKITPGDVTPFTLEFREPSKAEQLEKPKLAWVRIA